MKNEILHLFFANKTTKEQNQEILDYLDESPENYQNLLQERRLFDKVIMSERIIKKHQLSIFSRYRVLNVMRYAAVLLIAVGISSLANYKKRQELMSLTTSITTPAGQRLSVTLPDGTIVEMNASSTIEYPAIFSEKERVVKLEGEVFFNVISDNKRPFIVRTKLCNIEVLGTRFNVEAYGSSSNVTTSLVEGMVSITEKTTGKSIILKPNQKVICGPSKFHLEKIDNSNDLSWRNGVFSFKGKEFNSLIIELERHYGVIIALAPDFKMPNNSFTGKIRISDGLNHAMQLLQGYADFSYTYSKEEDNLVVLDN